MQLVLKKKKWINKLVSLPESGMGYQIVNIVLGDGRAIKKVVVVGTIFVQLPAEYENITEKDITEIELSI